MPRRSFSSVAQSPSGGSNSTPSPGSGSRRVSARRCDNALVSLQAEAQVERYSEVLDFIMLSCRNDNEIADQCHVICKRRERKMSAEEFFHRNFVRILMIPFFRFEVVLKGLKFCSDGCYTQLQNDKRLMKEVFLWLTRWSSTTEIGVTAMPCQNFYDVAARRIRLVGVLAAANSLFENCNSIDFNFIHGHFGFVCKSYPDDKLFDSEKVTEVVHHASGIKVLLPHGLTILRKDILSASAIEDKDDKFTMTRWGCPHSTTLKGPNGLSLNIAKLFESTSLVLLPVAKYMIADAEDKRLATRPSPMQPETIYTVRSGCDDYIALMSGNAPVPPLTPVPVTPVPATPLGMVRAAASDVSDVGEASPSALMNANIEFNSPRTSLISANMDDTRAAPAAAAAEADSDDDLAHVPAPAAAAAAQPVLSSLPAARDSQ